MAISTLTLDTRPSVVDPPVSSLVYGQQDPASAPGPNGGEASFTTNRGTELAPTGTGVWRYVDAAATGANDGTSLADAFTTITAAQAAAVAGDTIVIEPGTYREAIQLTKSGTATDKIKMTRRGAGRVVISGGEVLSGWTACTDQADALGSPSWVNCYKAFVPAGALANNQTLDSTVINGIYLGLAQDGVKLRLAINGTGYKDAGLTTAEKIDRAYQRDNTSWFFQGGSSPSTTTITNTSLSGYSSGDLTHAYAAAHYNTGNNVNQTKISGISGSTITVAASNSTYSGNVAIFNAGVDLDLPGMWCFSDALEADGTRKVVVYPYSGADLSAGAATVEYCNRQYAINFADQDHWHFFGLDGEMCAGWDDYSGKVFGRNSHNSAVKSGFRFEECRARNCASATGVHTTGFDMHQIVGLGSVLNCTVSETEGNGIYMSGYPASGATLGHIANCLAERCYSTQIKVQTLKRAVIQRNHIPGNYSAHGNGSSAYIECDEVVFAFNLVRTEQNFGMTFQEAVNLWYIGNDVALYSDGAYGILDNGTNPAVLSGVTLNGTMVAMNNTCGPTDPARGNATGLYFGRTTGNRFITLNNAVHGLVGQTQISKVANGGEYTDWVEERNNVTSYKPLSLDQALWESTRAYTAGTAGASYADNECQLGGNQVIEAPATLWRDVAALDFRPVVSGPLDGTGLPPASSPNEADLFPDTASWGLPAVDWNTDILGNTIDWTAPPIGAYA